MFASYNSRNCVRSGESGRVVLAWEMMSVEMSISEFVGFAGMLAEAEGSRVRSGELSRCGCGKVFRRAMGQYEVVYRALTLWFTAEEYEEFRGLIRAARGRLADTVTPSPFGVAWVPEDCHASLN